MPGSATAKPVPTAASGSRPISPIAFMYFVKETTTESVSGPPDMSVPAARAVRDICSPLFFASDANRTSADTSSASFGDTTSVGLRSKMLVSRLNFFSVSASSCTSPLMTEAICERKSIGKVYHLTTAVRLGHESSRSNQRKGSSASCRLGKMRRNGLTNGGEPFTYLPPVFGQIEYLKTCLSY